MTRLLPLFALLCLAVAAPSATFAADPKADAKKKSKKAAPPPAKKADAEPTDAAFQEFLNAPSTASQPAPEPKPAPAAEPRPAPRSETRQVEAAPADLPRPEDEERDKPQKAALVAPPPPPAPSKDWWGPTVGHAGAYFQLGFGYNWWSLDRAKVTGQIYPQDDTGWFFDMSLKNGMAGSMRGGYDVLGHAHIGFNFLATGWNVFDSERGGAGYIGGEIGWHPLSLLSALLPSGPLPGEKYYDLFLEGGAGYGIVGKHRAMDGGVGSFGLGAEGYPAPWVSFGVRATWYFPFYNHYILNYDHRNEPGMTLELPQGSGGSFFAFTGYLALHFGMPDK